MKQVVLMQDIGILVASRVFTEDAQGDFTLVIGANEVFGDESPFSSITLRKEYVEGHIGKLFEPWLPITSSQAPERVIPDSRDMVAATIIRDLLRVLHPGAVGLIHNAHGAERAEEACEAITAARGYLGRSDAVEVHRGFLRGEGITVQAEFEVPFCATKADKDAAFLAALAERATVDYLAIGDSNRSTGTSAVS